MHWKTGKGIPVKSTRSSGNNGGFFCRRRRRFLCPPYLWPDQKFAWYPFCDLTLKSIPCFSRGAWWRSSFFLTNWVRNAYVVGHATSAPVRVLNWQSFKLKLGHQSKALVSLDGIEISGYLFHIHAPYTAVVWSYTLRSCTMGAYSN